MAKFIHFSLKDTRPETIEKMVKHASQLNSAIYLHLDTIRDIRVALLDLPMIYSSVRTFIGGPLVRTYPAVGVSPGWYALEDNSGDTYRV